MDPFVLIGSLLAAGWAIKKSGDLLRSRSPDGSGHDSTGAGAVDSAGGTGISSSECGFGHGHGSHGGDCGGHGGGGHGGW
jgi:hypothetical protein